MTVTTVLIVMWILLIAISIAYISEKNQNYTGPMIMIAFGTIAIISAYCSRYQALKSGKPITPDIEIHTINGVSDTTYIYRRK